MTLKFNEIYTKTLIDAGLTPEQSSVYLALLKSGPRNAGRLPRMVDLSRPYVYKLLDELIDLGLVNRIKLTGTPAKYIATHPFSIERILQKKKEELQIADEALHGIMGSLISEYTKSSSTPGVRIMSGIDGLKDLYRDILTDKKDIDLIRSTRDDDSSERLNLVLEQIKMQVQANINTRLIGPLPTNVSPEELKARDKSRLTTRRVLPREKFNLPAQIIIYGDKVCITAYDDTIMTTIIENVAIASAVQAIFNIIWETSKPAYKD